MFSFGLFWEISPLICNFLRAEANFAHFFRSIMSSTRIAQVCMCFQSSLMWSASEVDCLNPNVIKSFYIKKFRWQMDHNQENDTVNPSYANNKHYIYWPDQARPRIPKRPPLTRKAEQLKFYAPFRSTTADMADRLGIWFFLLLDVKKFGI